MRKLEGKKEETLQVGGGMWLKINAVKRTSMLQNVIRSLYLERVTSAKLVAEGKMIKFRHCI
jgi:hypothetical protein